jgi:hypothetical protein
LEFLQTSNRLVNVQGGRNNNVASDNRFTEQGFSVAPDIPKKKEKKKKEKTVLDLDL